MTIFLLPLEAFFNILSKVTAFCVTNISTVEDSNSILTENLTAVDMITFPVKSRLIDFNENAMATAGYNGSFVQYCDVQAESCDTFCDFGNTTCLAGENACMLPDESWTCSWNGLTNEASFYLLFGEQCSKAKEHGHKLHSV